MATGTVTHALRKLYKAIVGQDIAKNNPTKIINDLADNWPDGITVEALSVTENGTYTAQEGKAYTPVTVNVSGGSSDFSTATVTIVNNTAGTLDSIYMPHAMAADAEQGSPDISMPVFLSGIPIETSSYNAMLYKGSCYFDYQQYSTTPVEITGSAEKLFDGAIVITGDCTITIGSH